MPEMTVAVLFGGASSEHEISLISATSVLNNIPREKKRSHDDVFDEQRHGAVRVADELQGALVPVHIHRYLSLIHI